MSNLNNDSSEPYMNCIWCKDEHGRYGAELSPTRADWAIVWDNGKARILACNDCFEAWMHENPDWIELDITNIPLSEYSQARLI